MAHTDSIFFTIPPERAHPFLGRLESYRVRYQRRARGWGRGAHVSPLVGAGMEFREFRDYVQGDDVRNIDWKTSARFARPFVRTFQIEENRFTHFLIDASESMVRIASDRKLDYARDLALALGHVALYSDDPAKFSLHPGAAGGSSFECTNRARLAGVRSFFDSAKAGGVLQLNEAATRVAREHHGHSGTVVILSDFLFAEDMFRAAFQKLAGRGLQVAVIQIFGQSEKDLPEHGEDAIRVRDAETGRIKRIAINSETRRLYQHAISTHQRRLQSLCYASRIWYGAFDPPDDDDGYLEKFTLGQLPGMGFLRDKV
tara:strand:- start:542 stop:1486 length:945 start_codon:yes stop_codon:yes gene_type:complete